MAMTQSLAILTAMEMRTSARVPERVVAAIAVEVQALDASPQRAAGFIKRRVLEHLAASREPEPPRVTTIYPEKVWLPNGDRFHGD